MYRVILIILLLIPCSAWADLRLSLTKVGTGDIHYLGFIKVYDAALYTDAAIEKMEVLGDQTSRCLELRYNVDLTADKFILGAETVLEKQYSKEQLDAIRPLLARLHRAYLDVAEGDMYLLCYDSASEMLSLQLNSEELFTVPSAELARVYFGIWLGESNPIDEDLRDRLLANLR